eukprot:724935-Amorphochlora_amoeboformis.AAC.1
MDFKDNTFDLIIDKGLTDCLLCGDDGEEDVSTALGEISRVLSSGGSYICVSFGDPESREDYFQSKGYNWAVGKPQKVPKPPTSASKTESKSEEYHWVYATKKK